MTRPGPQRLLLALQASIAVAVTATVLSVGLAVVAAVAAGTVTLTRWRGSCFVAVMLLIGVALIGLASGQGAR